MKLKTKLLFLAAVIILALPLIFAGNAGAKYAIDGAVPDGSDGYVLPSDGICIVGVKMDGTLIVAPGITNKRDCVVYNTGLTAMTTSDMCQKVGSAGNDGAKHKWDTGICVNNLTDKIPVSLKDLDKTDEMCAAKAGNTTAQKAALCVAFKWEYRGQDAAGAPIDFNCNPTPNPDGTLIAPAQRQALTKATALQKSS